MKRGWATITVSTESPEAFDPSDLVVTHPDPTVRILNVNIDDWEEDS